ncbi:MAG: tetratricopeptide repeat protein, partial [Pseudomonadota bacterium]|nr:tetratricopeptide repeat protein [Pseudomonadota bacterium]
MSFIRNLLTFNKTMRIVAMVVAGISLVVLFFLWRHYQLRSLGQDASYKAPMRHYSSGEKKLIRSSFAGALREYRQAKTMLEAIPGINLDQDYYYGIVLNGIGTVHLRVGIYGDGQLKPDPKQPSEVTAEKIREAISYFKNSEQIFSSWLAEHRPPAEEIARLKASRRDKDEDDIVLRPFERYERALSVSCSNLGMAARYLGESKQAIAHYKRSLALWPEQEAAKANLATLRDES